MLSLITLRILSASSMPQTSTVSLARRVIEAWGSHACTSDDSTLAVGAFGELQLLLGGALGVSSSTNGTVFISSRKLAPVNLAGCTRGEAKSEVSLPADSGVELGWRVDRTPRESKIPRNLAVPLRFQLARDDALLLELAKVVEDQLCRYENLTRGLKLHDDWCSLLLVTLATHVRSCGVEDVHARPDVTLALLRESHRRHVV
jgi:hypothetical protein